ncbi:hypothetical protein [Streptomyces sp. TLI_171]|uniref:hypothetical protein n=1 Tax=Streptomyces sp. TLI_171 TaxID=1938859 RepID=UPI000C1A23A6|nr:hypothetical protein [Streptomyces sp. TLI_171]RKE02883.1 hypothetical protein BX266_7485 [Streptomyces sp. TLI_171]
MTQQEPAAAGAVETAVEGWYAKRIGTLRMLAAGIPQRLAELLTPQLERLESELEDWRQGARLPDDVVLELYLNTFDPEHPEDDSRPLTDTAAQHERRARLELRRGLEALGYGLEPDPDAPPAARAPRWPTLPLRPLGPDPESDLLRAEHHVMTQYRLAIRAALTAADLEPLYEEQEHLYFPFASRGQDPPADGVPLAAAAPNSTGWHGDGVELSWVDNDWPKRGRGWNYGALDVSWGAGWDSYEPLPLPPFAHPDDIVDVVRQLLADDCDIAPRTREWEHADALNLLWERIVAPKIGLPGPRRPVTLARSLSPAPGAAR